MRWCKALRRKGRLIKVDPRKDCIKLLYKNIAFEITRKCNMKCQHCMRGDAQNHTISKEVIDKTLDEISVIGNMLLTGGEPFLEPEMIDYICEGIIKRKIPIMSVNVVTNGTIKNKSIAESFNKLTKYIAEYCANGNNWDRKQLRTIGKITVSCDKYHSEVDIMETLKFYRECLNEHTIITKETPPKKDEVERILYLGNATKNSLKPNQEYRYTITPYRVSFLKDEEGKSVAIDTMIQIGYDGKILIGEDSSYEQQDKNNYGNILDKPISVLLAEGAFDEPFTEDEAKLHDNIYSVYVNKNFNTEITEDLCKLFLYIFECVYCERERIHKIYPELNFDEIVDTAYHDMNIGLKETYGLDTDFYRIDNFKLFDTSYEESAKQLKKIKIKYPIETILGRLKYLGDKGRIEEIPDKITRERYKRFEV